MPSVLVPLAQGCEELEAITLIDLLRRAGMDVTTAGLDAEAVTASRGVRLIPDTELDAVMNREFDLIVLPGGLPGADHLDRDPRIQKLILEQASADRKVGAICAAPKVLASAGLLDNRAATAYPGTLESLQLRGTAITSDRVTVDGNISTSRGPGTAMDFALELIEQLAGKAKRDEVEAGLVR